MPDNDKKRKNSAEPMLVAANAGPPVWYAWLAVAAMFLLPFPGLSASFGGQWLASHLSPGEWLLLPLGVISLTLGLLTLGRIPERTLLPMWMAAAAPGVLWVAAETLAMFKNGLGKTGGDLVIAWTARLVFPTLAFLPLLASQEWRDRLYWALAGGLAANLAWILIALFSSGEPRFGAFDFAQSGFLENQHDYGMFLALALPLLAGWRGGANRRPALIMIFCMFLLPALALGTLFSGGLLLAAAAGLAVSWAAWRGHAWIMGIFLVMLVVGYGSGDRAAQDRNQRVLLASSLSPVNSDGRLSLRLAGFDQALATFVERPFLGFGHDAFFKPSGENGNEGGNGFDAPAWYASVLGASGLVGLLMWLALLAELLGRAVGRKEGRNCRNAGGVAGATVALAAAGIWTDVLAPGAGALVGFLLALSIFDNADEGDAQAKPRRRRLASDSIAMRRTRIMERVGEKKSERLEAPVKEKEKSGEAPEKSDKKTEGGI